MSSYSIFDVLSGFELAQRFRVHPHCTVCPDFIPFHGCIVFHSADVPPLFKCSTIDGHGGALHSLATGTSASVDMWVQGSVWMYIAYLAGN